MPNLITSTMLSPDFVDELIRDSNDFHIIHVTKVPAPANESIFEKSLNDEVTVKLVDSATDEILAFAVFKYLTEEEVHQVRLTNSYYSRSGHMMYIFQYMLVERGDIILSDHTHTIPGSMNFWKRLAIQPLINLFIVNLDSETVVRYKHQSDHEIWGIGPELMEIDDIDEAYLQQLLQLKFLSQELYDYIHANLQWIQSRPNILLAAVHDAVLV